MAVVSWQLNGYPVQFIKEQCMHSNYTQWQQHRWGRPPSSLNYLVPQSLWPWCPHALHHPYPLSSRPGYCTIWCRQGETMQTQTSKPALDCTLSPPQAVILLQVANVLRHDFAWPQGAYNKWFHFDCLWIWYAPIVKWNIHNVKNSPKFGGS